MDDNDTDEAWDQVLDQVRGIFSEHFHSWGFVVLSEDGNWIADYTNVVLGEMLFKKALEDFKDMEDFELDWDEDGDEYKDSAGYED